MKLKNVNPNKPVFSWMDPDTKVMTTWAAEELAEWCKRTKQPLSLIPINKEFAKNCRAFRGVENHRFGKFAKEGVKEPMLFLTMPDKTHLLVDGTHRYVFLAEHNAPVGMAYILQEKDWRPFVIEDYPQFDEHLLHTMHSGIKE